MKCIKIKVKKSKIISTGDKDEKSRVVTTPPRKATTLRIEMSDGTVIQHRSATKTFVEIIENNYPDLIEEIDFGYAVISKEKLPDFKRTKRAQIQLSNGYWLSTNHSTSTKADILRKISDELDLKLNIYIVDKR